MHNNHSIPQLLLGLIIFNEVDNWDILLYIGFILMTVSSIAYGYTIQNVSLFSNLIFRNERMLIEHDTFEEMVQSISCDIYIPSIPDYHTCVYCDSDSFSSALASSVSWSWSCVIWLLGNKGILTYTSK